MQLCQSPQNYVSAERLQDAITGESTTYKSIDTVIKKDELMNYPTEFLNYLGLPSMPLYILTMKI